MYYGFWQRFSIRVSSWMWCAWNTATWWWHFSTGSQGCNKYEAKNGNLLPSKAILFSITKVSRDLLQWCMGGHHVTKCLYKWGEFFIRFHMSIEAFTALIRILSIQVNHKQSQCASGGIEDANIVIACGLRWLGGESHKTNADAFHISISLSKRVVSCISILICSE